MKKIINGTNPRVSPRLKLSQQNYGESNHRFSSRKVGLNLFKLGLFCLCFFTINFYGNTQETVNLKDGRKILLFADGTWKEAKQLPVKEQPQLLAPPPFSEKLAQDSKKTKPLNLKLISQTKNKITDDEAWFQNNHLSLTTCEVPNEYRRITGNCSLKIPRTYQGQRLVKAFISGKNYFLIYGRNFSEGRFMLIADRGLNTIEYELDFKNYILSPQNLPQDKKFVEQKILWADRVDNILYVSHAHSTYAKSSMGQNAYLTAINLNNFQIIWRSRPLVANAHNFLLIGDIILSGYGFTAEPDFLYQINRHTGKILYKLKLQSGPDYLIIKDNKLFVRTYDTDYVFEIVGIPPSPLP